MTDFHKLSDFEIDLLVQEALSGEVSRVRYQALDYGVVSYCNMPEYAYPIMLDNGIGIDYDGVSWEAECYLQGIPPQNDWHNYPENPLRMAMIVYLMIVEQKKAKEEANNE